MIYVAVGTHEQSFDRLVRAVDALKADGTITEEVIIQIGYSTYVPQHCTWQKLFPYQDMVRYMDEARIVITHGGPSSFLAPLRSGKVPVVVPRQLRYGEHVNDHQLEFCREVSQRSRNILLVEDVAQLRDVLTRYDELAAACSVGTASNNAAFNDHFCRIVADLLEA